MDTCTDAQPTLGDTCQSTDVQSAAVDHKPESGDTALNVDSVSDDIIISPSNRHLTLVVDGDDNEFNGGQFAAYPLEEDSKIQMARTEFNDEQGCIDPQSHSDQDVVSASSKEDTPSEHAVVPLNQSSAINIDDSETPTLSNSQMSPSLCIRTDFSVTASDDEAAAGPKDCQNWTPRNEQVVPHRAGPARPMDEDGAREDTDYPCEAFPSSQPPSSSPPQLFSSSPCASSQSSNNGVEPSKIVRVFADGVEACASSHGCTHDDQVVLVTRDESTSEPNYLLGCDATNVETSPNYSLGVDPTSRIDGDFGPFKRMTHRCDSGESHELRPPKRPKPGAEVYLPPAPKRATVASHHRQFKKLTAPFRPPTKLSVVRDEAVQTMDNGHTETITSSRPEIGRGKSEPSIPATHLFRSKPKVSNTSRSAGQFKSPLVNKVLPGDSIRLTPTVQSLERKLQLLKRAIKVKEDNEEEVLVRLAGKWIEAGREVAYDLWDATKDAVDLEGKATFVRKSYGWNNTTEANAPWGWDTKPEGTGEGSSDPDSSVASYTAQRLVPEEDDDGVCNHTLGTMLRQLGIDPQTFGWDDDREAFCD